MDHNTETLKRLSNANEKPNNQVKLANVSTTALPPGNIKCNILKGELTSTMQFRNKSSRFCIYYIY